MNTIKQKRVDYLKTKLFVQALEYARMKCLGVAFENGARVLVGFNDRERNYKFMLETMGATAEEILLEMSVVDGERATMSKEELEEYTKSLKNDNKP
jgi:hypothetical protein